MTYAEPGVIIGVAGNKVDMPKATGFDLEMCRETCEGVDDLFLTVAKRSATLVAAQQKNVDSLRVASTELPTKSAACCP